MHVRGVAWPRCVCMHAWPSVCARVSVRARMRISAYFD
jgi:hypothetical protein